MVNNVDTASLPKQKDKKRKRYTQSQHVWQRFKRNKTAIFGLFVLFLLVFAAIFADVIAPGDGTNPGYDIQNPRNAFHPPSLSAGHLMGTDNLGRDIFARVIHGSRISLQVGFIVVGIALVLGTILGAISGFYGGLVDNVIMRCIDVLLAIPGVLLAIAMAAALGPGLQNVMVAVGISSTPGFARVVRSSVLSLREMEFIEAARAIGANDFRLIRKHIVPNCMAPIIVQATMSMAGAIIAAAALSFLGLGIQPPIPEWGAMLSVGRRFIRDFWPMVIFPGMAIVIVVLALNMVGDGLRDAFDPRLKR